MESADTVIPAKAGIQRAYCEGIRKIDNDFSPGFLPSQE